MTFAPMKVLRIAIRAVPAVKYALGVAGIAAAAAIVLGFFEDPRVALLGIIAMIGLMFVLLVFARLAGHGRRGPLFRIGYVLSWVFAVVVMAYTVLLTTSFLFDWPRPIDWYFPPKPVLYAIAGSVLDSNGAPLPGASITIDAHDFRAETQSDGVFLHELTGARPAEVITLRVTREGYQSYSVSRQLAGETTRFDSIRLNRVGH